MWKKNILSMIFITMALLVLITACATTDNKNPLRYEPTNLPADHRPRPRRVVRRKAKQQRQAIVRPDPFNRRGKCIIVPLETG